MLNGYLVNKKTNERTKLGDRVIIGRGVDADLCLEDHVSSRKHIEITRGETGFAWRDLKSRNGTFINGTYETAGQLNDGDVIRIGMTDLIFELEVEGQRVERMQAAPSFEDAAEQVSKAAQVLPDIHKTCVLLDDLYKLMTEITAVYDLCVLQDRILRAVTSMMGVQRGALFLSNEVLQLTACPSCGRIHGMKTGTPVPAESGTLPLSAATLEAMLRGQQNVILPESNDARPSGKVKPALCVPLRGRTRIFGVLSIAANSVDQRYSQRAVVMASALGVTAGLALENAFTHQEQVLKQKTEQENETARTIKDGFLLHDWDTDDDRFEIAGSTIPAKHEGGEFYDVVQIDKDTIGIAVGEVSGKGVTTALSVAQLLAEFRMIAKDAASPASLLTQMNTGFRCRNEDDAFCAMTYARFHLDTGRLTWANAGHTPALFIMEDTNSFRGEASGPALGVQKAPNWKDETFEMAPGATLLYFTSGVVDACQPGENNEPFGKGRLWTASEYAAPPDLLLDDIKKALANYLHEAEPQDGCAMIALRYRFQDA